MYYQRYWKRENLDTTIDFSKKGGIYPHVFWQLVFFIVIVIGFIWGIKNKRVTILDTIIITTIYIVYYFIGYLLHNDVISPISFKDDRLTISFVGLFLLLGTFTLVRYMIGKYIDSNKK